LEAGQVKVRQAQQPVLRSRHRDRVLLQLATTPPTGGRHDWTTKTDSISASGKPDVGASHNASMAPIDQADFRAFAFQLSSSGDLTADEAMDVAGRLLGHREIAVVLAAHRWARTGLMPDDAALVAALRQLKGDAITRRRRG
jgi:hypothetical protein